MRPQELPLILALPLLESSFYPSHTTVITPAAVSTRMHTTQFKAHFYLAIQSASPVFDLTSFRNVLTSLGPALLLPSVYFLVSFVGSLRLLAPRLVVFPSALPSLHSPVYPPDSKDALMLISWFQPVCWCWPVMWPARSPPATVSSACNPSLLLISYPLLCLKQKVIQYLHKISCRGFMAIT